MQRNSNRLDRFEKINEKIHKIETFNYFYTTMDDEDFEFSEEENAEFEREQAEERAKLKKHPLLKQAKEIVAIVDALLATSSDEQKDDPYGATLRDSAMIIVAKLSSGLRSDSYLLCMQNAAIIREHGEYLRLSNHMLNYSGAFDEKYVNMFREEMENFRLLFMEWAKEIRKMESDVEDEWGLFLG
jgi:hypothetical protein